MFQLDETGRFLYTKYGKSEEGVQTLGEKIIHGIHRFLEILEIVLAAIIVLVLVALMGIEIWDGWRYRQWLQDGPDPHH